MPNEVDKRRIKVKDSKALWRRNRPGHHRDANPDQKSPPSLNKAAAQSDWLQLPVRRWTSGEMRFTVFGLAWISLTSHLIDDASGTT